MTRRFHTLLTLFLAASFAFAPHAGAQPKKEKAKVVSQADLDRLEKKIDDQQKVIEKLVKLQQQYLQAMAGLLNDNTSSTTPSPAPAVDAPAPTVKPAPKVERAPVPSKPKAEAAAFGTVVGKVAGGADAIVYVETISAPVKGVTASMKQEGKQFAPKTLVVTKGTKVEFPNLDAIFHNVFSVTPDLTFDLGSYRQGESKSVTMSKSGVVTVYCNMHPQMVGHILVVPNGNYVRAGKDGFFRLANVPAGQHRIVAWAPSSKPSVVQASVADGEVTTVELELKKGRAGMHTKKDGLPYGSYEQ